jgi:hypothetical protein
MEQTPRPAPAQAGSPGELLPSAAPPGALPPVVRDQAVVARQPPASAAPPRPGPLVPGASILLVTVDALRADHMGIYGYARGTTPHIDRWARSAVVFERGYCPTPHTSFSITSLLTGRHVFSEPASGHPTLASVLRRRGYLTGAFFPPAIFFTDPRRLAPHVRNRFGFERVRQGHLRARERVDQAIAFLETLPATRPFFVWVHLFDPHEPYQRHEDFYFGPRSVDRYDGEIARTDEQVGRLLQHVQAHHPLTVVALTADHGEAFGEHGSYYHGNSLFEEQVRVPLLLRVPGVAARRIAGAVRSLDLALTLLSLIGVRPPPSMGGTDLGPWVTGESPDRLPPVIVELRRKRAVIHGGWKLIHDNSAGPSNLYHLDSDPRERVNLAPRITAPGFPPPVPPDGRLGTGELSDALCRSRDIYERLDLIEELGLRADPAATATLMGQLGELRTRRQALIALGRVRARTALPLLQEELRSARYTSWRQAAAFALGRIGGRQASRALREAVLGEVEEGVVAQALQALGELGRLPVPGARRVRPLHRWRCTGGACRLYLRALCGGRRELLLASRPAGQQVRVYCGRQRAAYFTAHENLPPPANGPRAVVVRLAGGSGRIMLEAPGSRPPRVSFAGIRPSPAAATGHHARASDTRPTLRP